VITDHLLLVVTQVVTNVSNMDKKGIMLSIISKTKVIVLRHKKKQYMTKLKNRE
jgi:hypothetical protein